MYDVAVCRMHADVSTLDDSTVKKTKDREKESRRRSSKDGRAAREKKVRQVFIRVCNNVLEWRQVLFHTIVHVFVA